MGSLKVMLLLLELEHIESIHPFLWDEKESSPLRSSTVRKSSPRYQDLSKHLHLPVLKIYEHYTLLSESRDMLLLPPMQMQKRERLLITPRAFPINRGHAQERGPETTQASKQTNTDASELQRATECIPSRRDQSRAVPRMMQKRY
jgi:hypothetical protein